MARPSVAHGAIPVDNETAASCSRWTLDGRRLEYRMTVIQQPVRARACGSGSKSSQDRRPIDPPPFLELQIFDTTNGNQEIDVTFQSNSSYTVYATLEQARPKAHGRLAMQAEKEVTAMTGQTVASIQYLDRPKAAGYFAFPDLSVRHEGNYRLNFSLFENIKEVKDCTRGGAPPMDPSGDFHHRLDVRCKPFTVYSAKKFPGLTESTALSRMFAEQGCRVRIRRDVRMRRRDTKAGGKDWDQYEDETADARARTSATPEVSHFGPTSSHGYSDYVGRARSSSISSHMSGMSRKPSSQGMSHSYHQPYGSSPAPAPQQTSFHPLHYPAPPVPSAMAPPPPAAQYSQHQYQQPSAPPATQPHSSYYGYGAASQVPPPSQSQYSNQQQPSYDSASRRASYAPSLPSPAPQQSYQQSSYYPNSQSQAQGSYAAQDSYAARAPPPRPMQPPTNTSGATSLPGRASFMLPPIQTDMAASRLEPSSPATSVPQSSYYSADTHKRSHSNAFTDKHAALPLRDGQRPSLPYGYSAAPADEAGDMSDFDPSTLRYRRADGRPVARSLH